MCRFVETAQAKQINDDYDMLLNGMAELRRKGKQFKGITLQLHAHHMFTSDVDNPLFED